jgi:hypothetical protein
MIAVTPRSVLESNESVSSARSFGENFSSCNGRKSNLRLSTTSTVVYCTVPTPLFRRVPNSTERSSLAFTF